MKRKRRTEEQIIGILKEHEAGMKTADLCRKHGISEGCFYNWLPAPGNPQHPRALSNIP
jgi:putative transposase